MKKKKSGKKKKKSAKGTKKSFDGEDQVEGLENVDPSTLISGNQAAAEDGKKKKKKGKKKKKMSKSEKALDKLEKAMDKIKANEDVYDGFISHMHQWLIDNAVKAIEMFKLVDVEGAQAVSYDEFKAGLFDLMAPVNKIEAHLLCKLLDEDDQGEIEYIKLKLGLERTIENRDLSRQQVRNERQLLITERKFQPCPCCKMSIVEPWKETAPGYIDLELRSVTFDAYQNYKGHLQLLVHSHLPICGLIQMIIAETDISSTKLAVFRDRSRSAESVLSPDLTLEELGFSGESREEPQELTLFYDYTVEFTDCPLLKCDHYFGQKVQVV